MDLVSQVGACRWPVGSGREPVGCSRRDRNASHRGEHRPPLHLWSAGRDADPTAQRRALDAPSRIHLGIQLLSQRLFRTGSGRTVQLFVNITKVWTEGDQRNGMDMVGLSVTFKK